MKWLNYFHLGRAFIRLVRDPNRLDEVFALSDRLREANREVLQRIASEERLHEVGALALSGRMRIGKIDLDALALLAPGTLGRSHSDFLRQRGLDPGALPVRPAVDEAGYVEAHLYETHDVWHTVTGFDTDVAGELGLQGFYAAQISGNLPITILALGMLNTLFYAFEDRHRRLDAIVQGYRLGRRAKPFFGVQWAALWSTPLSEVRQSLGVEPVKAQPPIAATPRLALAG